MAKKYKLYNRQTSVQLLPNWLNFCCLFLNLFLLRSCAALHATNNCKLHVCYACMYVTLHAILEISGVRIAVLLEMLFAKTAPVAPGMTRFGLGPIIKKVDK